MAFAQRHQFYATIVDHAFSDTRIAADRQCATCPVFERNMTGLRTSTLQARRRLRIPIRAKFTRLWYEVLKAFSAEFINGCGSSHPDGGSWHEVLCRDLHEGPNKKPSCQDDLGTGRLPLYPRNRSEDLGPRPRLEGSASECHHRC